MKIFDDIKLSNFTAPFQANGAILWDICTLCKYVFRKFSNQYVLFCFLCTDDLGPTATCNIFSIIQLIWNWKFMQILVQVILRNTSFIAVLLVKFLVWPTMLEEFISFSNSPYQLRVDWNLESLHWHPSLILVMRCRSTCLGMPLTIFGHCQVMYHTWFCIQ